MEEKNKNELVVTDMGLMNRDNANWLYSIGVLTYKGHISGERVDGISKRKILLYSYLRTILGEIPKEIPTLPNKVYLELDDLITLARTGVLEKKYQEEGIEYVYKATYPPVLDLEREGKRIYIANLPKDDKKKPSLSEEDFE